MQNEVYCFFDPLIPSLPSNAAASLHRFRWFPEERRNGKEPAGSGSLSVDELDPQFVAAIPGALHEALYVWRSSQSIGASKERRTDVSDNLAGIRVDALLDSLGKRDVRLVLSEESLYELEVLK